MNRAVLVTGTPGTGKTIVAKAIAEKLGCKYIDVKKIIKEHKLEESYDKEMKCSVVDEKKLKKILEELIRSSEECLVIDSHLSHYVSKSKATACIVTKCDLKELEKRMKARGYSKDKIKDNLECEIMQICESEAFDVGHRIITVDTTSGFDIKEIIKKIKK